MLSRPCCVPCMGCCQLQDTSEGTNRIIIHALHCHALSFNHITNLFAHHCLLLGVCIYVARASRIQWRLTKQVIRSKKGEQQWVLEGAGVYTLYIFLPPAGGQQQTAAAHCTVRHRPFMGVPSKGG